MKQKRIVLETLKDTTMMKTNLTIHIYTRASRANAAGLLPVYVRITLNGNRSEFTIKKYVDPQKWDERSMRVKGNTEEARTINSYLDSLRNKIIQTELHFQYQDEPVSLQEFMNVLLGKQTEKQRTLMPVFEEHNKRIYSLLRVEYSPGTYERYQTSLSHTRDFIKYRYGTDGIALSRIDHAFITDYDFYLRTERSCSNVTTVKYIKNFKKIIRDFSLLAAYQLLNRFNPLTPD